MPTTIMISTASIRFEIVPRSVETTNEWSILWFDDEGKFIEDQIVSDCSEKRAEEIANARYIWLVKKVKKYFRTQGIELNI